MEEALPSTSKAATSQFPIQPSKTQTRTYGATYVDGSYELSYNVVGSTLQLAILAETTGWVAFGIAEQTSGSMPGADIVQGM